jgi:hypothetical protein
LAVDQLIAYQLTYFKSKPIGIAKIKGYSIIFAVLLKTLKEKNSYKKQYSSVL